MWLWQDWWDLRGQWTTSKLAKIHHFSTQLESLRQDNWSSYGKVTECPCITQPNAGLWNTGGQKEPEELEAVITTSGAFTNLKAEEVGVLSEATHTGIYSHGNTHTHTKEITEKWTCRLSCCCPRCPPGSPVVFQRSAEAHPDCSAEEAHLSRL